MALREIARQIQSATEFGPGGRCEAVAADLARPEADFLSQIGHEIRTPLNSILGFAEIMREERLGPIGNARYQTYAADIHESAMHALSHAIGALHGYHHGLTNAVLMPYVLAFNRPAIEPALTLVAESIQLSGEPFAAVSAWIVDLRRRIGIPETLTILGLAGSGFPAIADLAAGDICASMNPVPADAASLESILRSAA